jgi:WD40 repeat protein
MKVQYVFMWLWCISALPAQMAAEGVYTKRSLTIPITVAALPAASPSPLTPSLECVAKCGTALPLAAIALSPDGKTLAVGGYQEVLFWDLSAAKLARRLEARSSNTVRALVFGKEGKSLAIAEDTLDGAGSVKVVDVQTGQPIVNFQDPKGAIGCLAVSPDGKYLAGGCADALAYVWNLEEKKLVATLKKHKNRVLSVCFSPNYKYLMTGSADKSWQTWEMESWRAKTGAGRGQDDAIGCCAFGCPFTDGQEELFRIKTAEKVAIAISEHHQRSLLVRPREQGLQFPYADTALDTGAAMPLSLLWGSGKNANTVYVACSDKTVKVFDAGPVRSLLVGISSGIGTFYAKPLAILNGHDDWVYALTANADVTKLVSASSDGTVKLWNTADNSLLATFVQLAPHTDEWLIVTGQGYFTTSAPESVQWKSTNLNATPEKLSTLQNAELVRQILAGQKVPPPVLQ